MSDPEKCPACGGRIERDAVDIGVGTMYGPPYCVDCGWGWFPPPDPRDWVPIGPREYRASGEMVCPSCQKKYIDHPLGGEPGYDGVQFLHRLCNGDLVKL